MPTGFIPFTDYSIYTRFLCFLCMPGSRDSMHYFQTGILQLLGVHIRSAHRNNGHRNFFLNYNIDDLFRKRHHRAKTHGHVNRKRFVSKFFDLFDLDPHALTGFLYVQSDILGTGIGTQGSQPTCIRYGGHQLCATDPIHGGLYDGIFDSQ